MEDDLLRTKFIIPPPRPALIARPRLIAKLNDSLAGQLTLVSAPAGSGKTTLLAAWASGTPPRPVAWLALDEHDDDLARFLTYLVAAISALGDPWRLDGLDRELIAHYLDARSADVQTLLMILLNAIAAAKPFALVLDDYHAITQPAIHKALAYLIEHLPPQMHLILCTRSDPPLPLPRLRARGQMAEIRQRDLLFSAPEAAQLLTESTGLTFTPAQIALLQSRTEGWAAGLQLASMSLRSSDNVPAMIQQFSGGDRHIFDYLLDEVLGRQPQVIQTFLLQTSILHRFNAALCAAVLAGEEDGDSPASDLARVQQMLETLDQTNQFMIPLDVQRSWYRYHRLFADLLRHTLRRTMPDVVPALYARASRWFEQQGLPAEAIDYALEGEHLERAAALLESQAADFLLRGEIMLLLRWLDRLPEAVIKTRPSLAIYHAWVCLLSGRPLAEIEARLADAQQAALLAAGQGETPGVAAILSAQVANMAGDAARSLAWSQQALDLLPPASLSWRAYALSAQGMAFVLLGDNEAAIESFESSARVSQAAGRKMLEITSLSNLAGLALARGQLHTAAASYRRVLDLATDARGERLPAAHRVLLGLGELAREWNDLPAAEAYFTESLALAQRYGALGGLVSLLHLARVKGELGDFAAAGQLLQEARQLALQSEATTLDDALVDAAEMRIWLLQGNLAAAARWLPVREGSSRPPGTPQAIIEVEQLLLARLALATGQANEALDRLAPLAQAAEAGRQGRRLLEILNTMALAQYAQGDSTQALATLTRSLVLAEPEGYVRSFIDFGQEMAHLLAKARSQGIAAAYCGRLLAAFEAGAADQPASAAQMLVEPLSDRELEVLRLIAEGLSNREIAARLFISLSTVKGHAASIYGKLGVNRRTLAVAKAREMDLL